MDSQDPQLIWNDYFSRKKAEREAEASILWVQAAAAGIDETTSLALDFVVFGSDEEGIQLLSKRLADGYQIQVLADPEPGYWKIKGTTRPYGVTLDGDKHSAWVAYMCDLCADHACTFSTWALEAPRLSVLLSSEGLEVDS